MSDCPSPIPPRRAAALDDPAEWARLVEAIGPASMLVVIDSRLGASLRRKVTADDIWQETLLHAWRDRGGWKGAGARSFRSWLLGIIDHRIADARDFFSAQRRSTQREQTVADRTAEVIPLELARTTTPSRMAIHREQAESMRGALEELPDDLRNVLHLRLFEGLPMVEVAKQLEIGLSAAKHRYRDAAVRYRRSLFRRLGTRRSDGSGG